MSQTRTLSLFLGLLLFLLLSHTRSSAQTITRQTQLQKTSQESAVRNASMQKLTLTLARKRGWPLTIRNRNGHIAWLQSVDSHGFPRYVTTTDNIISAATIGTSQLWAGGSTGLSLNGSSANMKGRIGVWDEGEVLPTHVELNGRVTQVDRATNLSDHSTHVSGTMIATGVNPFAKGMSWGAQQLQCYDFNNDLSEMMAASAKGMLVSNHSYAILCGWNIDDNGNWQWWGNPGDTSDFKFGQYDQDTQMWDSTAWLAPQYLIAKAAGNNRGEQGPAVGQPYQQLNNQGNFVPAGPRPSWLSSNAFYRTIPTYGCAKNILTIGAINAIPAGYTSPADAVMSDFSSWGPTSDGRIKPDLVADGVTVLSCVSSANNAYDIMSGTSMATPASAGSSFLLQEYYSKLNNGTFMRSATLKGILIHTADEAGPAPGPDYQFGWGVIDMPRAASMITSKNTDQWIQERNLVSGSVETESFTVTPTGKLPFAATICWTDPPATPSADPTTRNGYDFSLKLVNDLDLRITDLNTNTVYFPWVLDPANPNNPATRGDNFRDNVEKVQVDNLVPGHSYKITITHKGSTLKGGSQAYSLLVSGIGGTSYCTSTHTGSAGTKITNLQAGSYTHANTNGCKSYSDFTGAGAIPLPLGTSTPLTLSYQNCLGLSSATNIAVYIDYNNNGSFSDPGELVFQNPSPNALSSSNTVATISGTILPPAGLTTGTTTRMRIVAQDGTTGWTTPPPCSTLPLTDGETQDFLVSFTSPANDVGVTSLQYPTVTTCASDSQIVAIQIRNFGTVPQTSIPVTTTISNGSSVLATLHAVCNDSIPPGGSATFTYNTTFASAPGATYTITSTTALPGDNNPGNDQNATTLTISAAGQSMSGNATYCAANATQVGLTATPNGVDLPVWYSSATSTTPIAAGSNTSTTVITPDKTYYLGTNDLTAKLGPSSKNVLVNGGGAYLRLGNVLFINTQVPLTIESARMHIGYYGHIGITLGTQATGIDANGNFSYYPVYSTTVDVHPTKKVPDSSVEVRVAAGDNSDTGAVFFLNIPIPVPGNYVLLFNSLDYASAFASFLLPNNPYPASLPGVMSITGNNIRDPGQPDSFSISQKVWLPMYNIGIRLNGCPGPRTAITATSATPPTIYLNGKVFYSSAASGNQWLLNGSPITGATADTLTGSTAGVYQTVVTDPATGCTLYSNKVSFNNGGGDGSSIGLTVTPNPSSGQFQLQFYFPTPDNLSIAIYNMTGQRVFTAEYPNFSGTFYRQMDLETLSSGVYIMRVIHGGNTYTKKLILKKN